MEDKKKDESRPHVVCRECGNDEITLLKIEKGMKGERLLFQCEDCGKGQYVWSIPL